MGLKVTPGFGGWTIEGWAKDGSRRSGHRRKPLCDGRCRIWPRAAIEQSFFTGGVLVAHEDLRGRRFRLGAFGGGVCAGISDPPHRHRFVAPRSRR